MPYYLLLGMLIEMFYQIGLYNVDIDKVSF